MKKRILLRVGVFLLSLLVVVSIVTIYKKLNGTSIEHYAQYMFPCKGQIITMKGVKASIEFRILDEKEISELSDKNNIKGITFVNSAEKEIKAADWEVYDEGGLYQSDKYSSKTLVVRADFEEETTIKKLNITYPDKEESFEVGSLKILPLEGSNQSASTQIYSTPWKQGGEDFFINDDSPILSSPANVLQLSSLPFIDITINKIDLGIEGLGIDPSTIREVPENMDFGEPFEKDPSNQTYLSQEVFDELPDPNMELSIEAGTDEYVSHIVAIRKSKDYDDSPATIYYSPLYTCTENSSGVEYLYGDMNYMISPPSILTDKNAEQLLEEFGV